MEESTKKEDQIIDRRKKIRRDQLRTWMGRNVNFLDKFANQECPAYGQECHKSKRRITGQPAV